MSTIRREFGNLSSIKGLDLNKSRLETFRRIDLRICILHARWNDTIVQALVDGAKRTLQEAGVQKIDVRTVPGSFELPFAAQAVIQEGIENKKPLDAVIAIGVLLKGATMHFEYICDAATQGIRQVQLSTGVPVVFGILTCLNEEQAKQRAGLTEDGHNHGIDWGFAAIEMAQYKHASPFGANARQICSNL